MKLRRFESASDVMSFYNENKENNKVVIFKGKVYDVKEYLPEHPGGEDYIANLLGQDIEEAFEEAEHTKSAYRVLGDLPVIG